MWANPYTRLTHQYSGLPRRRMVSAYCLAPPCLTSPALGKIAAESGLIVSFVYSTDIVSRLSLGSVRDLTRSAAWLCKAEDEHGEGYSKVTKRALRWKAGYAEPGYAEWVSPQRRVSWVRSLMRLYAVPFYAQDARSQHAHDPALPSWACPVGNARWRLAP